MLKEPIAQREDDPGADLRGEEGLPEAECTVEKLQTSDNDGESDDKRRIPFEDSVVDDLAIQQRINDCDGRVDDDNEKK